VRIAVVGAGVSGLVSAYLLSKQHEVHLFERNDYFGGHANTHDVAGVGVDTGFIVYNEPAYPRFSRLLDELCVATQPSDMSFSVTCHSCGIAYSSRGLRGFFARPATMLRPARARFGLEVLKFYRDAPQSIESPELDGLTLAQYLDARGFGDEFRRHFIVPLAAAVWSTAPGQVADFPARYMLRFLYNHGLVGGGDGRWRWRSVTGGSRSYVRAITDRLECARTEMPVHGIERTDNGVRLRFGHDYYLDFDAAVIATHADEALAMLSDASTSELEALRCFTYSKNSVTLHTDASVLPRQRSARASWNYVTQDCRARGAELGLTYHLNRLQSLPGPTDYCVTVNPGAPIDPAGIISEISYTHPQYTFRTLEGQRRLAAVQGSRGVYFAGAHLGYGFHEDGVESAYRVAAMLGAGV
jgi:predicted NAD/FAD-binding protein